MDEKDLIPFTHRNDESREKIEVPDEAKPKDVEVVTRKRKPSKKD